MATRESAPPTIVIRPQRGLGTLGLKEVWGARELLYFLIWRDIKLRYKQTGFGAGWALVQPVALTAAFTIFLNRVAGIASYGIAYPVFAFSGLLVWTLFAQGFARASDSMLNSSQMVSKVYFPRLTLPFAAACSFIIDFAIGSIFLGVLLLVYGVTPGAEIVLAPLFALEALVIAAAIGTWLSAINVRFRDVRYTLPFLIQVWLFATPVAYSANLFPERWRTLAGLNPMAGAVQGFRWSVTGVERPSTAMLAISVAVTFGTLLAGLVYFTRTERTFADVI